MAVLLDAKQVSKSYTLGKGNTHQALKNVSLRIEEGEFVSVMGPSGSGKSTLLYNISGMDRADGGSVALAGRDIAGRDTLAGRDIASLSEKELANLRLTKMGFVFQQSNLLRNLSLFDNIILSAYLSGRKKRDDIDARAMKLMERTGISHLKDHDSTQVSGGEMQRASLCRALINEPAILFADEPTGALNSSSTKEVMDIFCDINQEGGAILLVTHDAQVAAYSDRVLFMMDGQIEGEYRLGKYAPGEGDLKKREAALSIWLSEKGF